MEERWRISLRVTVLIKRNKRCLIDIGSKVNTVLWPIVSRVPSDHEVEQPGAMVESRRQRLHRRRDYRLNKGCLFSGRRKLVQSFVEVSER